MSLCRVRRVLIGKRRRRAMRGAARASAGGAQAYMASVPSALPARASQRCTRPDLRMGAENMSIDKKMARLLPMCFFPGAFTSQAPSRQHLAFADRPASTSQCLCACVYPPTVHTHALHSDFSMCARPKFHAMSHDVSHAVWLEACLCQDPCCCRSRPTQVGSPLAPFAVVIDISIKKKISIANACLAGPPRPNFLLPSSPSCS